MAVEHNNGCGQNGWFSPPDPNCTACFPPKAEAKSPLTIAVNEFVAFRAGYMEAKPNATESMVNAAYARYEAMKR